MKLKSAITLKVGRALLQAKKNSPGLMFGVGIATMVGTVVLSSNATLKLEDTLVEAENKSNESNHKLYTAVKIGKLYGPAVGMGIISVGCLTGSHVVLTKRNAALTAAYAALNKTYMDYREHVRNVLGDDTEQQLHFNVDEKDVVRDKTGNIVSGIVPGGPSIYARFFDECCSSWSPEPQYNRVFLTCQQRYANDMLHARGHLFLNEVYDTLGIPRTKAGAVVGWVISKDGDNFVDFGMFDNKERVRAFVNGFEGSILLDFNVDGVIYDLI